MKNAEISFFDCEANYNFSVMIHDKTSIPGYKPWYTLRMSQKGSNSSVTFFSKEYDTAIQPITIDVPPGSYLENGKLVIPVSKQE